MLTSTKLSNFCYAITENIKGLKSFISRLDQMDLGLANLSLDYTIIDVLAV